MAAILSLVINRYREVSKIKDIINSIFFGPFPFVQIDREIMINDVTLSCVKYRHTVTEMFIYGVGMNKIKYLKLL